MAGAIVSPQAIAGSKAQHHAEVSAVQTKVDYLEAQLQAMQAELSSMKAASSQTSAEAQKVQELDQWMASVKSAPVKADNKYNMVFFRGGYGKNDHGREGSILTDANATNSGGGATNILNTGLNTSDFTGNSPNGKNEAWYFGAGFDLNLSDDLFGIMDNTNLLGEITFGYKQFDSKDLRRAPLGTAANDSATGAAGVSDGPASSTVCAGLSGSDGALINNGAGPYGSCSANVTVTQITITASPKIKFMADSKFRPWLIPAGFALHVISPPSNGVTVTAPGIMFAAGADYNIWKSLYVGVDARYHMVSNTVADVQLDGMEAGGYVGFGF
ncbi:MAG: porin family protein [Methylococcaceae bacterium]|nr:porin family protein [Methylococcaceae bacterium]